MERLQAAVEAAGASALNTKIDALKKEQVEMWKKKIQVAKELKNSERKRRRLKDKAKMLTDDDLLAVLHLRQDAKKKADAADAAEVSPSSVSGSAAAST